MTYNVTTPSVFESPRLRFRQLAPEDVTQRYVDWLNDKDINRFLETRHVQHDLSSCREFVAACNADPATHLFGIFDKSDKRHIGNIKIGLIHPRYQSAQLGLLIGERACWGKGYATEAIVAISRYAFKTLGLQKLEAGCYLENTGSLFAFLKAGYRLEGLQRGNVVIDGQRSDTFLLGLRAADVAELK